jgi:actin-related protein 5
MAPSATNDAPMAFGRKSPPAKLYTVNEPPFEGYKPINAEGYARSNHDTAIVIDNGILSSLSTHQAHINHT